MRLIDAEKLDFSGQYYNKSQMKAILDFIDNQPTSYDVDKVVEQLDRISDEMNDMILDADCPQYYDGYEDGVQRTIEIVKAGGVNG